MSLTIAIVGATGLVGTEILKVLAESALPISRILPVASTHSVGKMVMYQGHNVPVMGYAEAIAARPQYAIFSAGGAVSLELAPKFAAAGITVIDNSSAWRMDETVPLIVPEVNAHVLNSGHRIIANPNCSTIQMVMVLQPIHKAFGLKRVVVSTYQSVSGSGQKGINQLMQERAGQPIQSPFYPHRIDLNVIPHIDSFTENGYTKEEMKMINETLKIMGLPNLRITATTVRVPVIVGHSESVNIETERPFTIEAIKALLQNAPGVEVQDDPANNLYPLASTAAGRNETFVGRIRRDESVKNGLNCWIVADNLRKGAATNAVQIVEQLYSMHNA